MRMHRLPLFVLLPCASVTFLCMFLSCSKQVPACSVHSAPLPVLEPCYAPAFPLASPSGLQIPYKLPHTASCLTHFCCTLGRLHPSPDGTPQAACTFPFLLIRLSILEGPRLSYYISVPLSVAELVPELVPRKFPVDTYSVFF